eukprot:TRINITY_DN5998_c0_g1_i1.p1 TRINITY_DN5998_c0_g1~~TRINITY_DN5998_c0_g1_i1.p1  ORF type:complete len:298 (-),score=40.93 TRINITY_DN5998_c0_g1_i1:65-958(-)
MSVLVVGANGYIGFAIAQYIRQHGYKVYGLVRIKEQSHRLLIHEIIPIIGDASAPDTYRDVLRQVSIVVDCSSGASASQNRAVLESIANTPGKGKKVYIYTSGILVHGDSEDLFLDEAQGNVPNDLAWRVEYENEVVKSTVVHGIVIRPGFVYGYAGANGGHNLGDEVFDLTKTGGKIVIVGRQDKRWSWIHVYDLARAYFLAIQKYAVASGEIFDVGSSNPPTFEQIRRKAAAIAGYKNVEIVSTPAGTGMWDKLMENSVRVSSKKATHLLGWVPSHVDLLDDMEEIYAAWKALKK